MVSPAGPASGNGNSGTLGRSLTPASYHQSHAATGGKKRLHNQASSGKHQHQGERGLPMMKKSKLSAHAASAAAAAGPFAPPGSAILLPDTPGKANSNGFKRGIYLAFVDNALQEKNKGRPEPYNELVAQFKAQASPASASSSSASTPKNGTTNIKSLIDALTHVVAQLDRSHSLLVDSVLSLPWTAMDESFVNSHMRFVRALLTSRSEFVQMAMEKIVKGFRFQQSVIYAAESANPDTITRRQTYERLHTLLSSLIYLIPTLPSTLWPILNKYFPHKRESRNSQVVFISNALRIVEYCPQLGESVLTAIIVRALQIDVEIQVDIDDLEDDEGVLDEEVFGFSLENPFDRVIGDDDDSDSDSDDEDITMNPDDISSDDGDSDSDEEAVLREEGREIEGEKEEKTLSPKVIKRLKEMAAKLDAILLVMFKFLERITSNTSLFGSRPHLVKSASQRTLPGTPIPFALNSPRGQPEENDAADYLTSHNHALLQNVVYRVLLSAFEEKILRTFQTRHTQFVLFWYASLSPEFADEYTGTLLGRVVNDEETPTVTRVAASGYVASFISRSSHIDGNTSRQVMSLLCQCLDSELEQVRFATQAGPISGPEADRLVKSSIVFYAVAQAAFYIFCFRWKDFLDESEEEIEFLEGIPAKRRWMLELESLKMAVNSPLNPLKMCAQTVVSQFARMAHKTDFMYCHSIIEQNKRQSRSRTVTNTVNSDLSQSVATPTLERPYNLPPGPSRTASQSSQQPMAEQSIVQDTLREAQIDSHFPFDPYKLPLSAPFIQGIYRDWDGGGFGDDDSDEEEEEDVGDDNDDDTSTEAETSRHGDEEDDDSSMQASSMDSDAIMQSLKPSYPSGAVTIEGMIDPSLLSDEDDHTAFSQSFEAMSVSPRRGQNRFFSRS